MAFVGGVNFVWFLGALGALTAAAPTIWTHLSDDRRNRILVLFDASIDPDAQNERYQVNRSIRALQNGGIRGQGLYNGTMVQSSSLPMQRNDFIFSAIGEELGMLGCLAVLLLLSAVIIRIIHVGIKSGNYMNRLICVGIAGMMASQILINVGVCLGLVPVIGPDAPVLLLRRQLAHHDVPCHGHRLRHQHASCAGRPRPVYPAKIIAAARVHELVSAGRLRVQVF